ncbi:unnamed protein product, partial [Prorocentrum cordatum]
ETDATRHVKKEVGRFTDGQKARAARSSIKNALTGCQWPAQRRAALDAPLASSKGCPIGRPARGTTRHLAWSGAATSIMRSQLVEGLEKHDEMAGLAAIGAANDEEDPLWSRGPGPSGLQHTPLPLGEEDRRAERRGVASGRSETSRGDLLVDDSALKPQRGADCAGWAAA